eukprot:GHVU01069514.1.p1 GENE.GHVU01069514.1~~GHVU01069514.1.p1  ORF type:complete len:746 (-),score=71.86 GHVU01069514.1:2210-4447(-)
MAGGGTDGNVWSLSGGRAQSSTRERVQTPKHGESDRRYSFGGVSTPRTSEDDDEAERNRLDHPMPVFGRHDSSRRAESDMFSRPPSPHPQTPGSSQINPWFVSNREQPLPDVPGRAFLNSVASGRSAYGPTRTQASASAARAHPYCFTQSTLPTSPPSNKRENLNSRPQPERCSASHSAGAAMRSPPQFHSNAATTSMAELQAAIEYVQQNNRPQQADPYHCLGSTSPPLASNSNSTCQQQNTTHTAVAQTGETFAPLTVEENKGLTRATAACKGELAIFDPLDECCLDAHVAELSGVLSSVGLDESNTKYLIARTGSKEVQRIVKELGPLHQRPAIEVVNHVACKLFPRSNHYLTLQRWLMTPLPLTSTRVALRLVTLTLERLETLRVRRKLGALPPDSEKSEWLFNKLPVIAQNAIYQNMEGWTYQQLVAKIERGILPAEETATAALTEWEMKLTASKPPCQVIPPLVFTTQQSTEPAPREQTEAYHPPQQCSFASLPPLPAQQMQQQQTGQQAYQKWSNAGTTQPRQQQTISEALPRQDPFFRAGAPEKWQQQQQQRTNWPEKKGWPQVHPAEQQSAQHSTPLPTFTNGLGETLQQCSKCHQNHASRCFRCPPHLLCARCAMVGHSSEKCYATIHDQTTSQGVVRVVVTHNAKTGSANVRIHQHSQQTSKDWMRFVDMQAAIAAHEAELARRGFAQAHTNTTSTATATPPNTQPMGSLPPLLPQPPTQVAVATPSLPPMPSH